ncbi:MAG: hypothetical protein ABJB86_06445 [Bacteroidota bacterium]
MTVTKEHIHSITAILLFTVVGFLVYAPVLGNTFLSDDYDSLYRIFIEKRIIYREFLRPMIDITFYFNFLISGLSPGSYYIFNVLTHICNAFLLFRFVRGINMCSERDRFEFALIPSFLFLIYPFHNESISWLSGRLSSMACFFALLSLLLARRKNGGMTIFFSILCYLAGLLCYESIIILPILIFIVNWPWYKSQNKIIPYSLYWLCAIFGYLLTKFFLSGRITGSYGSRVADDNILQKILNTGKVLGRLFLPPSDNQYLLIVSAIGVLLLLIALHVYLFKSGTFKDTTRIYYRSVLICLAISLLIPVAFGVSTRTSEGDRLLYFPSCFLCILIGSWLIALCKKSFNRWLALIVITFYCTSLLEINNRHWIKASVAANTIMNIIKSKKSNNITFINMPDELEGAFVFRNGFRKALVINKIDTGKIRVFNYLTRSDYLKTGPVIRPVLKDSIWTIFPFISVLVDSRDTVRIMNEINKETLAVKKERNSMYYWNKEALIRLF